MRPSANERSLAQACNSGPGRRLAPGKAGHSHCGWPTKITAAHHSQRRYAPAVATTRASLLYSTDMAYGSVSAKMAKYCVDG